jgi:prepilin-type N-terminal cleavage/methylation domain-containing protein
MIRKSPIDPAAGAAGFSLLEVTVSLILVGIVATFTTFFLATGIEGYVASRDAAGAAVDAQIALDRLALELRRIDAVTEVPTPNALLKYTSNDPELGGNRWIKFAAGSLFIQVDGTDFLLLSGVTNPVLQVTAADLDHEAGNEVSHIDIGFTVDGRHSFDLRIFPRNLVPEPT